MRTNYESQLIIPVKKHEQMKLKISRLRANVKGQARVLRLLKLENKRLSEQVMELRMKVETSRLEASAQLRWGPTYSPQYVTEPVASGSGSPSNDDSASPCPTPSDSPSVDSGAS